MHNFFVNSESRKGKYFIITGSNYNHIKNVLRMKKGDIFLVSVEGLSHLCELEATEKDTAIAKIITENYQNTNLPINIYLFQGLPKSDKMELIIQKAVELGVHAVIPVEMSRSVVRLEDKKKKLKQERWQSIAESAAKQSKRTVVPKIFSVMNYKEALKFGAELDLLIVPYENKDGMTATLEVLSNIKSRMKVGILIGPEGGFEESEIDLALNIGGKVISLGKRILRTETAAITAVGMCMLYAEMKLEENI